ncbi:general substrate transporter [Syncephalis plumigaleata]|nr:general substrate transporter [Syncephalis plumigaleata]
MTRTLWIAAISSSLCGFYSGYDISTISAVLAIPATQEYFQWTNSFQKGFITSSYVLGAFISSFFGGYFIDRYGRRTMIIASSLIFALGASMQTASNGLPMLYVARILGGIGKGLSFSAAPLYNSEIAPKDKRGAFGFLRHLCVTVGMVVAGVAGYGVSHIDGTASFRTSLSMQVIPAVLVIVGMIFSPMSPRWLVSQGREIEARKHLARLLHLNENDGIVAMEVDKLTSSCPKKDAGGPSKWKLITDKSIRRVVLLSLAITGLQNFCGSATISYYGPDILKSAGVTDSQEQLLLNIGNSVSAMVFTLLGVFTIDKLGRKSSFVYGGTLICSILVALATLLALDDSSISREGRKYGVLTTLYSFNGIYSITWGPVTWLYLSEIFPQNVRATMMSLGVSANLMVNFFIAQLTPYMMTTIGWRIFVIYAVICLLASFAYYFILHETKNKSLEEITQLAVRQRISISKA